MQTLLGFDFGTRRIGVAVGQDISGTASTLCTLSTTDAGPDWDRLTALVTEWQPTQLVVGLPRHADGTDSATTRAARKFARQLEQRYRLPVHLIDERLSSHAASELAEQPGNDRAGLDAMAARIILQDWLDTH